MTPALPVHLPPKGLRHLLLVLGDQLHPEHPMLAELDPQRDAIVLIEAPGEATHVWSHPARITVFLAAMRHFADRLAEGGWVVNHLRLDEPALAAHPALCDRLSTFLAACRAQGHTPTSVTMLEPGEWRLQQALRDTVSAAGVSLREVDDPHYLCSRAAFRRWAGSRRQLRMETFYRWMRQQHRVLMDGSEPAGGRWNFDEDNRQPWPATGPGAELRAAPPARFEPDAVTREVMALVARHFPGHPGTTDHFIWPVTREQALLALRTFIDTRLPHFGPTQDAQWAGEPFGWHSLLSVALNLHLLDPREVMAEAEAAWRQGHAPLASVEGFIRQILGWREFIRGVYWLDMPELADANHLQAHHPLPDWFWTGQTDMACLRDVIGQTLKYGYAHHIQRLMVTGLYALIAGLDPKAVAAWYLAVYVDAVEWVELPNVAGMALYANGGRFTSKPYAASGAYIQRMSNHCQGCRYRPTVRTGATACPFTTLYWDFLRRHEAELAGHPRTALMVKHLQRMSPEERQAIHSWAEHLRTPTSPSRHTLS